MHFDTDNKGFTYYKNAVDRHWNPAEIDLSEDADRIVEMVDEHGEDAYHRFVFSLKGFSVGEETVTDDLAPFAVAVDDPNDQAYLTTQMYEEAKHTQFFDRYWREVLHEVEDELGLERTYPKQWEGTRAEAMTEGYTDFFTRVESAVEALLEDNSPKAQAYALCHYHLMGEGVGAQTGYYSMHSLYGSDAVPEIPILPGFMEGMGNIRQDEGRHVGWGMSKLKQFVADGDVSPEFINETVDELMVHIQGLVAGSEEFDHLPDLPEGATEEYAMQKHEERMQQIVDASEDIPNVDELTQIETAGD